MRVVTTISYPRTCDHHAHRTFVAISSTPCTVYYTNIPLLQHGMTTHHAVGVHLQSNPSRFRHLACNSWSFIDWIYLPFSDQGLMVRLTLCGYEGWLYLKSGRWIASCCSVSHATELSSDLFRRRVCVCVQVDLESWYQKTEEKPVGLSILLALRPVCTSVEKGYVRGFISAESEARPLLQIKTLNLWEWMDVLVGRTRRRQEVGYTSKYRLGRKIPQHTWLAKAGIALSVHTD